MALQLRRQIGDLAALAESDDELADAYQAMIDERRQALERLTRRDGDGDVAR